MPIQEVHIQKSGNTALIFEGGRMGHADFTRLLGAGDLIHFAVGKRDGRPDVRIGKVDILDDMRAYMRETGIDDDVVVGVLKATEDRSRIFRIDFSKADRRDIKDYIAAVEAILEKCDSTILVKEIILYYGGINNSSQTGSYDIETRAYTSL